MKTPENTLEDTTEDSTEGRKYQGMEVAPSSESGSIHESLETLHQAISHDELITEENLNSLNSAFEGMKITIGGKEVTLKVAEGVAMLNTFLGDTNVQYWNIDKGKLPTFKFEFTDPKELEYKEKAEHPDVARFGEYTLNPETFAGDFEKAKVFIPDLSAMEGKELHQVFQYVVDTYGDKYHIPGIEYWKWMIENPDKAEEAAKKQKYDIKDGNEYYFPGSSLCGSDGRWLVPCAGWNAVRFGRSVDCLEYDWGSGGRVLLLEK